MQMYLVGGAVRDRLLGLPVRERDWVVVGGTPDQLEALGYRRVGRTFPVYLHPETGEEYALARTETKTGPGYRGFEVHTDPSVTLEQDLGRRDLTINAIAKDSAGRIIDPFGGQQDLQDRLLRHVSDAFHEDPVRILRVARFAARFHALGFRIADETMQLMREMVAGGEVSALVPERVWRETESALAEVRPDVFFRVLQNCGALAVVFPEVDALFGVPQPEQWHPEIDTGVHVLMALRQAARLGASTEARFAVLAHDLGKGTTPESEWPSHPRHEQRSVELANQLCQRLGAPNRYRELAGHVARYHGLCHQARELRAGTILKLLQGVDAFRRPDRFEDFLAACEADARGRTDREDDPYPEAELLRTALRAAAATDVEALRSRGLDGEALGNALNQARAQAIATATKSAPETP
jgi:tRNA nucleotidyltransferase (CCA-adding enzyme)